MTPEQPTIDAAVAWTGGGAGVRESARAVAGKGWRNAIVAFVAVIWLIPVRAYKLPVNLPFNLEVYRLVLLLLLFAFSIAVVTGTEHVTALGRKRPMLLLVGASFLALAGNLSTLSKEGLAGNAFKAILFFVTALILFLLVGSTIKTVDEVRAIVMMIVIGGAIVGAAAVYEGHSYYNVFDHLDKWFPFLQRDKPIAPLLRGARLRVRASSQHPIALGVALCMCAPLAIYFVRRATSKLGMLFWSAAGILAVMGAMATLSRTTLLVLASMAVLGFWVRREIVVKLWPLVFLLPVFIHVVAPGALGTLLKSFDPNGGLVNQLNARAGQSGSGRLADVNPGLRMWIKSPLYGIGLGALNATGAHPQLAAAEGTLSGVTSDSTTAGSTSTSTSDLTGSTAPADPFTPQTAPIIFDDQYMNTLVSIGLLGLIAVVWLIWGSVRDLGRTAKQTRGDPGELLSALTIAAGGFGVSMATFDAFSFVQVTLLFFLVVVLGLRLRAIVTTT